MNKVLDELVKRIVEVSDPEKIILFGSQAKGQNNENSDFDICVLKKNIKNYRKIIKKIYRNLFGIGISVDIILESTRKYNQNKDKWFLIYSEIKKSGKVIYEK